MAPWGNPDVYIRPLCEDGERHVFTEGKRQNPHSDTIRGFVTAQDETNTWHKIPGFYSPEQNKFVADTRSKWAPILTAPTQYVSPTPEEIEAMVQRNRERLGQ